MWNIASVLVVNTISFSIAGSASGTMTIMSWFFVLIVFLTGLCHGEALARKRSSPWCLSMNGRFGVRGGADFTEVDEPSPMVPVATIGSTPYISELEIAKAMVLKVANTLVG